MAARLWVWIGLSTALAACGPTGESEPVPVSAAETSGAPEAERTATEPEVIATEATDPALRATADALPFRWFETAPVTGVPSLFGAIGAAARLDDHIVGDELTFEVARDGTLTARGATPRWRVSTIVAFTGEPVIAGYRPSEGSGSVVVAGPIAGGWLVECRAREDGALRWRARGATAIEAAQLGVEGELVALHLRAADQDGVAVLSMRDGAVISERTLDPTVTRISREPPPTAARSRLARGDARIRCTGDNPPRECTLSGEGAADVRWTSRVFRECHAYALAEDGDDLVLADLCDNATGVEIHAASIATGALRWSTRPFGIGPIAHSRWSNEVAVAIEGRYVRVWGEESRSIRYVSTLDRATGRELATITAR